MRQVKDDLSRQVNHGDACSVLEVREKEQEM